MPAEIKASDLYNIYDSLSSQRVPGELVGAQTTSMVILCLQSLAGTDQVLFDNSLQG